MRKKTTLSTIVIAAIIAVFSVHAINGQSTDRGIPPQQPLFTPKNLRGDDLAQPIVDQEEVAVPSILSGKKETIPAPPTRLSSTPKKATPVLQPPTSARQLPPASDSGFPAFRAASMGPASMGPAASMANQPLQGLENAVSRNRLTPGMQIPAAPDQETIETTGNEINQVSGSDALNSLRGTQIETSDRQELQAMQPTLSAPSITDRSNFSDLTASDGPKLRVTSVGPSSITIGKPARFEVHVQNLESRTASSVIVGVNFPEWVDVTSAMPSTGSKELTGDTEEPMMVWQIPIVEGNATEKIMIDVIPREARPFDIDIEWTFKPIRGKTTVEVVQPQLSIQIAGPTEVQFGEKAIYDVTVSNPGTGIAENVSVMLPEVLGGERAKLDDIAPQQQKKFQVELIARSAGTLDLTTTVVADGGLKQSDTREIIVRRAILNVALEGPPMKYAGTIGSYQITVSNQGDAMARDVIAAVALPPGIEFVSGIDNVEKIEGGIRWTVGMLSPGNKRTYQMKCNMTVAGELNVEAATKGAGDLSATDGMITMVDAVADLVLSVTDPKGPLPTGEQIEYEIRITNRGTKAAKVVNVVMHFSDGVEPTDAEGIAHEMAPGQVTFAPIAQIDPGQEVILKVLANASQPGSHRFRAQLLCEEADAHEVAEGTTRFYGDAGSSTAENGSSGSKDGEFKR